MMATTPMAATPMPAGLITFLDPTVGSSPPGWEEYQDGQGRLFLSTGEESLVGNMQGIPVAAGSEPTHTHVFDGTVDVPYYGSSTVGGSDKSLAQSGTVTIESGQLDPAGTGLGFMHLQTVRSLGNAVEDPIPYGAFAFYDRQPPASWSIRSDLSGRFLLPSSDQSQTFGNPWDPTAPPTHQHAITGSLQPSGVYFTWGGGANHNSADYYASAPLSVTKQGCTVPVVPFLTLFLCEKTSMPSKGKVPVGLTMFFGAADPPEGWRHVAGADDRFIVGLPGGGEPGFTSGDAVGATASHSHTGTATVTLPKYDTDLVSPGLKNLQLAKDGSYTFSCQGDNAQLTLPAVTLLFCVYTGN